MRVEIERELATKMIAVYVIEDGYGGGAARVWTPYLDGKEWIDIAPGAQAPRSLYLPDTIFAALMAAGTDVPVPSRAQFDHLSDAREVRDRLLTIVERCTLRPPPDARA
jgi:hypothetical protein